jgi:hypothetical protein
MTAARASDGGRRRNRNRCATHACTWIQDDGHESRLTPHSAHLSLCCGEDGALHAPVRGVHEPPQARVRISTCPAEHSDSVCAWRHADPKLSVSVHGSTKTQPNHLLRVTVSSPHSLPHLRRVRREQGSPLTREAPPWRPAVDASRKDHRARHASTSRPALEYISHTVRPSVQPCCASRTVVG